MESQFGAVEQALLTQFKVAGWGAYMLLTQKVENSEEGYIPFTDQDKELYAGGFGLPIKKFCKVVDTCLKYGLFSIDGDMLYLRGEKERKDNLSKTRSEAGRIGAINRWEVKKVDIVSDGKNEFCHNEKDGNEPKTAEKSMAKPNFAINAEKVDFSKERKEKERNEEKEKDIKEKEVKKAIENKETPSVLYNTTPTNFEAETQKQDGGELSSEPSTFRGGCEKISYYLTPLNKKMEADLVGEEKEKEKNCGKKEKEEVGEEKKTQKKIPNFDFKKALMQIGIPEQMALDWMAQRKVKAGVNTETAFNLAKNEFEKAMQQYGFTPDQCVGYAISKGWCGFKYIWLKEDDIRSIRGEERAVSYGNGIEAPIAKDWKDETSPELLAIMNEQ